MKFYKVRGGIAQKIRYVSAHVADTLVLIFTAGYYGSNFVSKHIMTQTQKDIREKIQRNK